jgi:hypothetical protein
MKWIRVEKQLPGWGETVIVAHRRYSWSNARHRYTKMKTLGVRPATFWTEDEHGPNFSCGQDDRVDAPVAWMPLPEPPQERKK